MSIWNPIAVSALSLSALACSGGGTVDIMADDTATFVGSASLEQKYSDRYTVDVDYLVTTGSSSQLINTGIQFGGNRVTDGRVDSDFTFQALTAHFEYTYFKRDRFSLTAAPALQLTHTALDAGAEGLNLSFNELFPAYGLKLGTSFQISNQTRAIAETAVYDQRAGDAYFTSGIWLEHDINQVVGFKFGYSTHIMDDGDDFASDGCTGTDDDPADCENSGFSIRAAGLHAGIKIIQ